MNAELPDIGVELAEATGITLPHDRLKMVFVHPPCDMNHFTRAQPFRWTGAAATAQLESIRRVLDIAVQHRADFTVFPEYALPGLVGVGEVEERIRLPAWPENSFVVAGVDGLVAHDFETLTRQPDTTVAGGVAATNGFGGWFNVCLTWAKRSDEHVRKWVQPKIRPNSLERVDAPHPMFNGGRVLVFQCSLDGDAGSNFDFMSFICSDWFARLEDRSRISDLVFMDLNRECQAAGQRTHLGLVLVPQCNEGTNDAEAIETARILLEGGNTYSHIDLDRCLVALVNFAGRPDPGMYDTFGRSCIIGRESPYYWKDSPDTYAVETQRLMQGNFASLGRCKNALFREFGACVHTFELRLPASVRVSNQDRSRVIDEAEVHAYGQEAYDNRTPGAPVPAVAKWVLDRLGKYPLLSHNQRGHPLHDKIEQSERDVREGVGRKALEKHRECPFVLSPSSSAKHVDSWGDKEENILDRTLTALSVIGVSKVVEIANADLHGKVRLGTQDWPVLVVAGDDHAKCFEYAKSLQLAGLGNAKAILLTDDLRGELQPHHYQGKIDQAPYVDDAQFEYANPNTWFHWRGLANLENRTMAAKNKTGYTMRLKGALNVESW